MSGSTPERRGVDVVGPRDGQPVVFVHGAAMTRAMWAPQRRALAEEYRVVAPDLPGHGDRADETFAFEPALELLEGVIATETGATDGGTLLVGLSLGGYLATEYARRNPEDVDGLVISGSSANPVGGMNLLTRATGALARLATRSDGIEGRVRDFAERWVRSRDLDPEVEREIVESGFYPRQFGVAGPHLAGRDFRAAFAAYPGPSLVLNGETDLVMRRGEQDHAAAARTARVEVLADAGHICNLHRPEGYVDALKRFDRRAIAGRTESR
ncbi:alpha/beta fold hydrolase [Salinilacihabitans rarus]|uniref:alpha/beta fold hydrolase n=1 Tax=Salinilacihabitans rarus TaxID=2961596 RepID=UPI0020C91DA5|nr:alpha/beta hydrolase [Salinilacihabitans rarus]